MPIEYLLLAALAAIVAAGIIAAIQDWRGK